jgi:hypothetical protein
VLEIRLFLLGSDNSTYVLQKINATSFARTSVGLLMMAGRALKAQRGMASRTEPRNVACFGTALRALHV